MFFVHLLRDPHKEAILFIEDLVTQKMELSEYLLKQIHGIVLYGIDRENAGVYRKLPVAIAGSKHLPPQPYLLQDLMEDYFRFYKLHIAILNELWKNGEEEIKAKTWKN